MVQTQQQRGDAHNSMMGRMASALMLAGPSSCEVLARRARLRLVIGLVPAVLVLFGFGICWWIVPGGS
jgi:hypothetical protein